MVETGLFIPHWISLLLLAIPLLTSILLLRRRAFGMELVMTFLLLVNLMLLAKHTLSRVQEINQKSEPLYISIFNTGEFALLMIAFLLPILKTDLGKWILYLLISFISIALTLLATQHNIELQYAIWIIEAIILVLACLFSFAGLLRITNSPVFQSPLFWIVSGTFIYYSMFLCILWIQYKGFLPDKKSNETGNLLLMLEGIRLLLYLLAATRSKSNTKPVDGDELTKSFPGYRL